MNDGESVNEKGLDRTAYELKEGQAYVPYVQGDGVAEFTVKSVLCGAALGVVFGAANTYLGLMAGLTISTSIPVAVLTVVLFRALGRLGARHTILEANMSQTIGSASSSVASGVLFTIPALFIWGMKPALLQLTLLAMSGGLIGILAMIPLRRFLIRREHTKLPYPEGLACAEVLVASKEGGSQATGVFWGLGLGLVMKLATEGLKVVGKALDLSLTSTISVAVKVSPALIGVGYILGPRIASVMVAGSALSTFILIPAIAAWGAGLAEPFYPETELLIRDMKPGELREKYIRYIGAGAVAAAGILTLIRSFPLMLESFRVGLAHLTRRSDAASQPRTERDLSFAFVLGGVSVILAVLICVPGILGFLDSVAVRALTAVLIAIFAFFFVTVASRIVGLVGVTSNPTSGMTIATLLGTSLIFWLCGWTDLAGKATALMVGTTVCIAASISGDASQDLKTGFLLGATPRLQQIGELLGVLTSAFFVCWTVVALDASLTVGSEALPAPQAVLMNLVIDGVIDQSLPWTLILIGASIAVGVAIFRLPPLAFAVGVYLPISTMAAVFLGGLLSYFLQRGKDRDVAARRRERGVLFGSGLVGGEGLMGVVIAVWVLISGKKLGDGLLGGSSAVFSNSSAVIGIVGILCAIGFFALRRGMPAKSNASE